jgi:hypothetical protein
VNAILMTALTPEERLRLRAIEEKRRRDAREQRLVKEVAQLEETVQAIKALLSDDDTGEAGDAAPNAR